MLRCAASIVIAAYAKIRLIPLYLRALPLELACPSGYFTKQPEVLSKFVNDLNSKNAFAL